MIAPTTTSKPPSTAPMGQPICPDQPRHVAQPMAAKNQSNVSVSPAAPEAWSKSPGSSPNTKGRATIKAVIKNSKNRRNNSGPERIAGADAVPAGCGAVIGVGFFLRRLVGVSFFGRSAKPQAMIRIIYRLWLVDSDLSLVTHQEFENGQRDPAANNKYPS